MLKIIIVVFILALSGFAYAATDYTCLNDCTQRGYMYNYCLERCSYNDHSQTPLQLPQQLPHQQKSLTDSFSEGYDLGRKMRQDELRDKYIQCVDDCTSKGNKRSYCKEECSY